MERGMSSRMLKHFVAAAICILASESPAEPAAKKVGNASMELGFPDQILAMKRPQRGPSGAKSTPKGPAHPGAATPGRPKKSPPVAGPKSLGAPVAVHDPSVPAKPQTIPTKVDNSSAEAGLPDPTVAMKHGPS